MSGVSDLIDTTEMYLRTLFELTEEGVLPMRARIAERLSQSGPTVSQTVARMQRDGLLELDTTDRHVVLTAAGYAAATRVMRKHRLAECLLVQVIGLPWEKVHNEACRWEHVIGEDVERRLLDLLGRPQFSPFGTPIPGLAELDESMGPDELQPGLPAPEFALAGPRAGVLVRLGEQLQVEEEVLASLWRVGAVPGAAVVVSRESGGYRIGRDDRWVELPVNHAAWVVLTAGEPAD
jgi:DtxR family Mn-dependent transcriptional regulator